MTYKSIWASTESLTKQRADKISKPHYKDLQNTRVLCQSISKYSVAIIFSFDSTNVNSARKTSKNLHVCRLALIYLSWKDITGEHKVPQWSIPNPHKIFVWIFFELSWFSQKEWWIILKFLVKFCYLLTTLSRCSSRKCRNSNSCMPQTKQKFQ